MPNPPAAAFSPAHVDRESRYAVQSKLQHDKLLRGDPRNRFIVASAVIPSRSHSVPHQRASDPAFSSGRSTRRGHFPAKAINRHSRRSRLLTVVPEGVRERRNATPETHDACESDMYFPSSTQEKHPEFSDGIAFCGQEELLASHDRRRESRADLPRDPVWCFNYVESWRMIPAQCGASTVTHRKKRKRDRRRQALCRLRCSILKQPHHARQLTSQEQRNPPVIGEENPPWSLASTNRRRPQQPYQPRWTAHRRVSDSVLGPHHRLATSVFAVTDRLVASVNDILVWARDMEAMNTQIEVRRVRRGIG
jgi:hypothetical protein